MSRKVKELMVRELAAQFGDIARTGCVLMDYKGLSAAASDRARRYAAERGGKMTVVKNSVFVRALEQVGAHGLDALLEGSTAVLQAEDAVQAARMAMEIMEMCGKGDLKGGYADGRVMSAAKIEMLSQLPGREQLLSQVLAGLQAPLCGFAHCLKALLWRLAWSLDRLREKRENEGSELP